MQDESPKSENRFTELHLSETLKLCCQSAICNLGGLRTVCNAFGLERIGNHTHELSMRAPWWSSVTTSTRSAPSQPSRDSTATPAAVIRRPRRGHRHRHPDDASPLPSKRLRPHDHATSTIVRTPTAVDDLGVFVGPRLNRPARQGQPPVADGYSSRRDTVTSALDTSDTAPVRNAKLDFDGWSNKK
jgi:hypothetical protein